MITADTRRLAMLSRRRFLTVSALAATAISPIGRIGFTTAGAQGSANGVFLASDTVHAITVSFAQADYDAMIQAYIDTEEKEWISATVTIDGAVYEQVGLRLKGNSSLGGLRISPEGGAASDLATPTADGGQQDVVQMGPGGDISADAPESLPWLIRLDKYVDDQNHGGLFNLVIRSNRSETSLNEAVALDLLDAAGLASQRAAATAFTVNDGAPKLRLAIELPDEIWLANHFSPGGLLFKAEATGNYTYRGDDPAAYDEVFDLEAGGTKDDSADFTPLTAFLDFINNSDDATFAAELPGRLDIDGFATYLAMMGLIENFDDISGPGNNAYLYIAPESQQVTVVPWDMNLAFGSMGAMRGAPGDGDLVIRGPGDAGELPEGGPPAFADESGTPVATDGRPTRQIEIRGPGGANGVANPLVERFNAVSAFATRVDERTTALRTELYDNGVAATLLSGWAALLTAGASDLVEPATVAAEADQIAEYFTSA
ncbi:MAG: CotH kinase family protein [Thermomicrobiales bacterium]|nr:CotH kinase family protein [Thermomicrobiales bacterium]